MRSYVSKLLMCILLIGGVPIYATSNKSYMDPRAQVLLPSSEAQSLGDFAEVPVDLYTGRTNINIPLFTVSHNGIEVPVSLSYHGGGIKVDDECGLVGLGWTLNAGGAVSRIVRGMPDDLYGPINGIARGYDKLDIGSKNFIDSLMIRQRPRNPMAVLDSANQRYMLKPMEQYGQLYDENKIDVAPDNYLFYANGLSGAFVGTNAEYVQSSGGCKIQSSLNGHHYILNDINGHSYTFGQHEKRRFTYRLENVFNKIPSDINPEYSHLYTSAWWLSSIISSAKDTITFDYITEKQLPTRHNFYGYTQYDTIAELYYGIIPDYVCHKYTSYYDPYRRVGADTIYHQLLSKIKTPNCLVQFHYSHNSYSYSRVDSISIYSMEGTKMGRLIESFKFRYSDYTNTAQLSSIIHWGRNNKSQSYQFTYYSTTILGFSQDNRDHWGYFSRWSEGRFADKSYLGITPQCLNDNFYTERYADNENASHMMLKSITYPSGLVVNFTWEPHQFSELSVVGKEAHAKLGEYDYSYSFTPECNVGGVRIKRIEYLDGGKQLLAKEYAYVDSNDKSTGILAYSPRYAAKYPILAYCEPQNCPSSVEYETKLLVLRSNGLPYVLNGGGHIEYKQVTEYTIPDVLDKEQINRIDYYFSSSNTENTSDIDETLHDTLISADMLQLTSMRYRRGDLIKKVEYTDDHKVTEYEYQIIEQPDVKQVPGCIFPIADYQQSRVHYSIDGHSVNPYKNFGIVKYRVIPYNKRLVAEILTSDKVSTYVTYSYATSDYQDVANANLPETHTYIDSEGNTCEEYYEYWGTTNKIKTFVASKNGYVIDAYSLSYDNLGRVNKKQVALLSSTSPITMANLDNPDKWILVEKYEYYPKINKIKEVHDYQKNITTTYLWSYGGQYPIAEIKNDSLETIENEIGKDYLTTLQNSYMPNMSQVDTLRSLLPHAQITTMTYAPLIGMTSLTDAKGYTQYFEYDDFGRLCEIYENVDGTKSILKSFDYQLNN